jgi:hypothetical protein
MFKRKTTTNARLHRNAPRRTTSALLPALLVICFAGALPLQAEEGDLPKAEKILDGYVEAAGGLAAYDAITNRFTKGSLELVAQGITMNLTVYSAKPNNVYLLAEAEALGKMESGVSGDVVWANSVMQGPQIKEGQEKIDSMRDATFDRLIYWRKNLKGAETISLESIDGKPAYKVVTTPKQGKEQTLYFDQASKLLVKIESTVVNQMGEIPVEAYIEDYREIDGVRLPHRTRVNVMGQERLVTTHSVEHNVQIPPGRFNLPADVQALLDKGKSATTESVKAKAAEAEKAKRAGAKVEGN